MEINASWGLQGRGRGNDELGNGPSGPGGELHSDEACHSDQGEEEEGMEGERSEEGVDAVRNERQNEAEAEGISDGHRPDAKSFDFLDEEYAYGPRYVVTP